MFCSENRATIFFATGPMLGARGVLLREALTSMTATAGPKVTFGETPAVRGLTGCLAANDRLSDPPWLSGEPLRWPVTRSWLGWREIRMGLLGSDGGRGCSSCGESWEEWVRRERGRSRSTGLPGVGGVPPRSERTLLLKMPVRLVHDALGECDSEDSRVRRP